MEILIYIFLMYGLSFALVYAAGPFDIFIKFREITKKYLPFKLGDAYDCMFCTPCQLGLIFSLFNIIIDYQYITPSMFLSYTDSLWYINIFLDGAITGGFVYFLNTIQEFIENNTKSQDDEYIDDFNDEK